LSETEWKKLLKEVWVRLIHNIKGFGNNNKVAVTIHSMVPR
jgi:hypothetical protein